jgi:hypothetical protein
LDIQY